MTTLKEIEIAERALESQFNAAGSAMMQSEYLRRATELHEAKQAALRSHEEPPQQATMTARTVRKIFADMFKAIAPTLTGRFADLEKRVAELERTSGIGAMARSIQNVERTLRAPVVPQFDAKGKLIGARRELPHDDDVGERVSMLEHRAARHAEHLKSLERKSKDGR